jgi:hypothetical protein
MVRHSRINHISVKFGMPTYFEYEGTKGSPKTRLEQQRLAPTRGNFNHARPPHHANSQHDKLVRGFVKRHTSAWDVKRQIRARGCETTDSCEGM